MHLGLDRFAPQSGQPGYLHWNVLSVLVAVHLLNQGKASLQIRGLCQSFNHVNDGTADRGISDLRERLDQRLAVSAGEEVVNIVHGGGFVVLSRKAHHARRTVEKGVDWNVKDLGKLLQTAGTNAIGALFIFLDLLECEADAFSELFQQLGPKWRQEPIAMLVIESLFRGEALHHYRLGPFVIMANHVHVLLLPSISPNLLLKSLKGVTAREANRTLGRTGEQFWRRESYDHWVRDDTEWTGSRITLRGIP